MVIARQVVGYDLAYCFMCAGLLREGGQLDQVLESETVPAKSVAHRIQDIAKLSRRVARMYRRTVRLRSDMTS